MADTLQLCQKASFQAFTAVSGSLSAEEGCTDTNAYWEALLLRKAAQTPMLTGKNLNLFSLKKGDSVMDFLLYVLLFFYLCKFCVTVLQAWQESKFCVPH